MMKHSSHLLVAVMFLLAWNGCSHSSQESAREERPGTIADSAAVTSPPARTDAFPAQPQQKTRRWKERFIPTGLACGVMVEFTGIKKEKELRAHYAVIELEPSPENTLPDSSVMQPKAFTLVSSINDLRQAFFKVPPGKYTFRQLKDWADKTPVSGLEVRKGNYSLVTVDVFQAWLERNKATSESGSE